MTNYWVVLPDAGHRGAHREVQPKTAFLLRFLDDTKLRQAIEKQLNKIELSHKFAKAIFFGNNGTGHPGNNQEFMVGSKEEQ